MNHLLENLWSVNRLNIQDSKDIDIIFIQNLKIMRVYIFSLIYLIFHPFLFET